MGYEGRSRSCWGCFFFLQAIETYRNGKCMRHAPARIDFNLGEPVDGDILSMASFPNVIDPETGFCGKFVPAEIAPPAIIPPPEPPTPS